MSLSVIDAEYAFLSKALGTTVGTIADLRKQYYETMSAGRLVGVQDGGLIGPSLKTPVSYTKPTLGVGSGATLGFYALANDPTNPNRVWVQGLDFGSIGFTDNNGASWTPKTAFPGVGAAHQMEFASNGFVYLTTGPNTAQQGQVFRSPIPDANGNGLVWAPVFNFAAPPGTVGAIGDNACLRPQCLATNGPNLYLGEYSVTPPITGGPTLYYSPDSGATWSRGKQWGGADLAKHIHTVEMENGAPLVMLGDASSPGFNFTGIGLWRATALNGSTFQRISQYGEAAGGNTLYGIASVKVVVNGKTVRLYEYDGAKNRSLLKYPGSGGTVNEVWPFQEGFELPVGNFGTMRSLTKISDQVVTWVQTSEVGALGPQLDSAWASLTPFNSGVKLFEFPSSSMVLGKGIVCNGKVWAGNYLFDVPQFFPL